MINTILARLALISCLLLLAGCTSFGYLAHTANGHLELMNKREPIDTVLQREDLDPQTRKKLVNAKNIREFASNVLELPDNNSYTQYVELNRDYVTWVVFAAPEFSLQPVSWCFWIIGCVPYRGYFEHSKAVKFAQNMSTKGMDVFISPVAAYSTLGWFSDPVLSSMLNRGEVATADIIFHELAHQQLYVKDDTDFNEAFATAVARAGVRDWLRSENKDELLQIYERSIARKHQIYGYIPRLRLRLKKIYAMNISDSKKREHKKSALNDYRTSVSAIISDWKNAQSYRAWALQDLNNAKLNAISTYQELTADFLALFEECDREYSRFYAVVASMSQINKQQRRAYLRQFKCKRIGGADVAQ